MSSASQPSAEGGEVPASLGQREGGPSSSDAAVAAPLLAGRQARFSDPPPVVPEATLLSQAELLSFRVMMDKAQEEAGTGLSLDRGDGVTYAQSDIGIFPEAPRAVPMEPVTLLDIDRASHVTPEGRSSEQGGGYHHGRLPSEGGRTESSAGAGGPEINPTGNPDTRAADALQAYARMGIFGDSADEGESKGRMRRMLENKEVLTAIALIGLSLVVVGIGVLLQTLPYFVNKGETLAFRWCYFTGAVIPIYYICRWITSRMFHAIELIFFREFLAHYESLTTALRRTATCGVVLLWYFVVFHWAFCDGPYESTCQRDSYKRASFVLGRTLLCILIASLASLIASVCTKIISTHFYRSTHFKKLHEALGKEFQLKALSSTRQRRKPKRKTVKPLFSKSAKAVPRSMTASHAFGTQPAGRAFTKTLSSNNFREFPRRGSDVTVASEPTGSELMRDGSTVVGGIVLDVPLHEAPYQGEKPKENHKRWASGGNIADLFRVSSVKREESFHEQDGRYSPYQSATPASSGSFDDDLLQLNLGREILQQMPLEMLDNVDNAEDLERLSDQEIERLRTAVVIKTYSNLIRHHKCRTPEDAKAQLADVANFGKALFANIRGSETTRKYVTLQDFQLFYKDDKEGQRMAENAFRIFSVDLTAHISRQEVIDRVQALYKERADIATSLHNTETMMNSMESGLAGALHFLFIGFYFLVWGVDVLQGLSTFSATVLALSFIFGNSIRNTYESMLFLFVQHPYDVGDWIMYDNEAYTVRKISLLNTSLLDFWNRPSTVLNSSIMHKSITNLSRCTSHAEYSYFQVDVGVAETIKNELHRRLRQLCRDHPTEYEEQFTDVKFYSVDRENLKITILLIWWYKMTPDDWQRKRDARDAAVAIASEVIARYKQQGATFTYHHRVSPTDGGVPLANML